MGEGLEMFVLFGGGILVLFAAFCGWETKHPRDTDDRRTGRPWGYVGQWPPNGREPPKRRRSEWQK